VPSFVEEITMAVLITTTFVNVPQADYDVMIDSMRPMYLGAPGFVAHVAVVHEGGFRVSEIWESQEDAEAWLRDVIVPSMERAGGVGPDVVTVPIHAMILQNTNH
jgi:hypothetical protein